MDEKGQADMPGQGLAFFNRFYCGYCPCSGRPDL